LYVAKVDLDNFYHRLRIPVWMQQYFALPPVPAAAFGLPGGVVVLYHLADGVLSLSVSCSAVS